MRIIRDGLLSGLTDVVHTTQPSCTQCQSPSVWTGASGFILDSKQRQT